MLTQKRNRPNSFPSGRIVGFRRGALALGFFGDFFFLGALFLFFFLELVVDEFEDSDLGAVTDADAGGDDARVTARAIGELRSDVGEEALRPVWRREVRGGLAARCQSVALAEGDDFFRDRTGGFRARQRRGDAAVLEQVCDEIAQRRAAVPRIAAEFRS